MLNVSVAVQAHPARTEMAEALAAQIPGCEVVYDPCPPNMRPSAWRTYRLALERTPADCTHRLVIQDDALLCRDFSEVVPRVAEAQPDALVCLFVAGHPTNCANAVFAACDQDHPFCDLPVASWIPAVATMWPVELIAPALAFVDEQNWPVGFTADDEIIGRAARALGARVVATVPSLVEHPDEVASIAGPWRPMAGKNVNRVAACFIHDLCDPLAIDWTA